jgi:hypothetical protein
MKRILEKRCVSRMSGIHENVTKCFRMLRALRAWPAMHQAQDPVARGANGAIHADHGNRLAFSVFRVAYDASASPNLLM